MFTFSGINLYAKFFKKVKVIHFSTMRYFNERIKQKLLILLVFIHKHVCMDACFSSYFICSLKIAIIVFNKYTFFSLARAVNQISWKRWASSHKKNNTQKETNRLLKCRNRCRKTLLNKQKDTQFCHWKVVLIPFSILAILDLRWRIQSWCD